jgi:hypothetical protein
MRTLATLMTGLLLGTAIVAPAMAQDRGGREGRGAMMNGDSRREAVARGRDTMNAGAANAGMARSDDRGSRGGDWNRGGDRGGGGNGNGWDRGRSGGTPGGMSVGVAPTPPAATPTPAPRPNGDVTARGRGERWSTDRRDWDRGNGATAGTPGASPAGNSTDRNWTTDRQRWDRNGDGRPDAGRPDAGRPGTDARNDRDGRNDRDDRWARGNDGRNDGRDGNRDRADGRNDGRDWSRDRDRNDGRNGGRDWDRNDRRDHDRWKQSWRDDRRYAWRDYRNSHRSVYRLPRYQPPRWGYSYRRWDIGYRWDSWFYTSNYWISDPWQYRLPPAYGPYRWVRYYDDAVLVDTYTGEIVDIIYDFFF